MEITKRLIEGLEANAEAYADSVCHGKPEWDAVKESYIKGARYQSRWVWNNINEAADLRRFVVLADTKGGFMSPPVRWPFSYSEEFIKTMNKKYGANYDVWAYMDELCPMLKKKED